MGRTVKGGRRKAEWGLLQGVRVLDLTQMLAGPFGSMLLADMGAEVIKIEEPETGDRTRTMGPHFVGPAKESAYFVSINRNKRSLALDLKREGGKEVLYDLVKVSDVVFEAMRPGVAERLGVSYADLKKVNPRIIYCSLTAFGQDGPYRDRPAFDLAIQALAGAMSITGEPGRPPVRMGIPMGDLAGGFYSALAISAALHRREKTGTGCRIDLSLLDSLAALQTYVVQYHLAGGAVPGPVGSAHQTVVPYQAFRTEDGYIVVAVFTEKFWEGFCRALGLAALMHDARYKDNSARCLNRAELIPVLEKRFLGKGMEKWLELLNREGVPCAPINTIDRLVADPQLLHRGMLAGFSSPHHGRVKTLGSPVLVDGVERRYAPPPLLGENSAEILSTMLRYPAGRIRKLRESGAIR